MLIAPISAPLTRKVLKQKRWRRHTPVQLLDISTQAVTTKKRAHQPKPRWTHHQFLNWKPSLISTAGPHHIGSESSPKTFKAIFIPNLSIDDMPRCLPSAPHTLAPLLSLQPARWEATVDQPSCQWNLKNRCYDCAILCQILAKFGKYTVQYIQQYIQTQYSQISIHFPAKSQVRMVSVGTIDVARIQKPLTLKCWCHKLIGRLLHGNIARTALHLGFQHLLRLKNRASTNTDPLITAGLT